MQISMQGLRGLQQQNNPDFVLPAVSSAAPIPTASPARAAGKGEAKSLLAG